MLGAKPLADITAPQLLAMAKKIAARGALDIAKRSLQTCVHIFRYAVAHGTVERNPAADVKPGDALKPRRKEHCARVDAKDLPALLRAMEAYDGSPCTRFALQLIGLTFLRTSALKRMGRSAVRVCAGAPPERSTLQGARCRRRSAAAPAA